VTEKDFFVRIANGKRDILGEFLALLEKNKIDYCVIGGLAVNAYAEPVISLDLDVVVAIKELERLRGIFPREWRLKEDRFSINISTPYSDLRIQLQTDERYQDFIGRAVMKSTLGYALQVAQLEDVVQGEIWAYMGSEHRESKRLKDLSDIKRLLESNPDLAHTSVGRTAGTLVSPLNGPS
jgi:hypothetical protein